MSSQELHDSLSEYENQLKQVELAIKATEITKEREDLLNLRDNLNQLINLTKENIVTLEQKDEHEKNKTASTSLDDEYAMFMAEMKQVGAVDEEPKEEHHETQQDIETVFKSLENMKCQAPYNHQLSGVTYHNALVCGVISEEGQAFEEIKVRVMYTNPIFQEMLPCPYFLESECKFSDEKCRFSHGEIVSLESLREYKEPNFMSIKPGDRVLMKLPTSKLWQVASIVTIGDNQTCTVRIEMNKQEYDVHFENIFPLDNEQNSDDGSDSDSDMEENYNMEYDKNIVETSLTNTPISQALGGWEKYTKGIGSKLLQKMGYVVGTGLGLKSDGRIEPVDAVLLPTGKSLDHCMEIREKAGGDVNFFKVEKKLQRLQKKQEERNQKAYEREKAKTDVFTFLNDTLKHRNHQNASKDDPSKANFSKSKHRRSLQSESLKDLNVSGLKIEEDIRRCEHDLYKITESLTRYSDKNSVMNKNLKARLMAKQIELDNLRACERNIQNEQCLRKDKKKLTVF